MQKLIKNYWIRETGSPYSKAKIIHFKTHPEGLDLDRIKFHQEGGLPLNPRVGHILSINRGAGYLLRQHEPGKGHLRLAPGVHLYLPPGEAGTLTAEEGTEILHVYSPSAEQARGKQLLLVDEEFLAGCASKEQALRWAFTPHLLCRLIFLHHDQTLLSKTGDPISWFRTTMFDTDGLPENEEGIPSFRISYNSRTEINVCCDLQGSAQVRMAKHPYRESNQLWGPWLQLDGDSSYHLNEATGSREEECHLDAATESLHFYRNKHELRIEDGYLTLFSLFDPAPTGLNFHHGNREEEPLPQLLGTRQYDAHLRELAKYDEMVAQLSMAKAKGTLPLLEGFPAWDLYREGCRTQAEVEREVLRPFIAQDNGRATILTRWMQLPPDGGSAEGLLTEKPMECETGEPTAT